MDTGDRVALRSDKSWTGRVSGPVRGDMAPVEGDNGWSGTLPVDSLVAEDKSWPPAGLEHK